MWPWLEGVLRSKHHKREVIEGGEKTQEQIQAPISAQRGIIRAKHMQLEYECVVSLIHPENRLLGVIFMGCGCEACHKESGADYRKMMEQTNINRRQDLTLEFLLRASRELNVWLGFADRIVIEKKKDIQSEQSGVHKSVVFPSRDPYPQLYLSRTGRLVHKLYVATLDTLTKGKPSSERSGTATSSFPLCLNDSHVEFEPDKLGELGRHQQRRDPDERVIKSKTTSSGASRGLVRANHMNLENECVISLVLPEERLLGAIFMGCGCAACWVEIRRDLTRIMKNANIDHSKHNTYQFLHRASGEIPVASCGVGRVFVDLKDDEYDLTMVLKRIILK